MTNLPVRVPADFRIIAHRGAPGYAPENTLAAFRLAERISITEIELDVQFSKDQQLVICHDQVLDRYGYPNLRVADLTLDELLALDMGSWVSPYLYGGERLLALDTLLAVFCDRFTYHVEIKVPEPGLAQALLNTITAHGLRDRTIVTSRRFEALTEVRELAPNLRAGRLVKTGGFTAENVARAAAAGLFQICPRADETTKEMVAAAHTQLPEVRAYGVNDVAEMMQAIEAGCNGLTIDWPDWLVHKDTDSNGGKQ